MLRYKVTSSLNPIGSTTNVNMSSLSPALLDDNIADDCACANTIYNRHGFWAWFGWVYLCRPAPDVTPC